MRSIAFIGVGAMGEPIARGVIEQSLFDAEGVILSDIRRSRVEEMAQELGARVADDNAAAVRDADIVLLAVKPQTFPEIAPSLRPALTPNHLVLSIMAGVSLASLRDALGEEIPVVRVMPNILAQVGEATSAYAMGATTTDDHRAVVESVFGSVGVVEPVEEKLLDAVTGLSGSGPGFAFVIMEALADGGVKAGLPRELAMNLAARTLLGAARMKLETGLHPAELKDRVTSPGGTTIAGIAEMEASGVRSGLIRAVEAAARRSRELSGPA